VTRHIVLGSLIGGAFYLLLIDNRSGPELYLLAGVALACGVTFMLAREQGFVEARLRLRWLAQAWRVLLAVPRDIAFLSRYGAVKETPSDTGRRAMTEGFGSVTPNTVVLGVDSERGLLLVHQLRRHGGSEDLDVLRLG
jgi:hypothetical protein